MRFLPLAFFVVLSLGCSNADMHPGSSCASCHDGRKAPTFSAAGTVYPGPSNGQAVTVTLVDAKGRVVSLPASSSGNFSTHEELVPPLQITITRGAASATMADAPNGDCNGCHNGQASGQDRVQLSAAFLASKSRDVY